MWSLTACKKEQNMKKLLRQPIALSVGLAVAGGFLPAIALAQTVFGETALLNLAPRKVHMKTVTARVLVDGNPIPISPGEILMVAGENVAFFREAARSFTWAGWDLPPGPHTVSAQFKTYPDGVGAHSLALNRTLTIDVLKP